MTMAGNCVKFTTKNNVNTFIMWPQDTLADKVPQISWTVIPLSIDGLVHSNRQFLRNLTDYVHIKFNYIAFKVTDVCQIGHDIVEQMGSGGSPQYIAPGVNAFLGTVPLNVNWDVEQDFSNIHGQKGNVDPEGFAQHPSTKTIRPGDKKKPSFVWRFPRSFRQFYETNQVTTAISQTSITDFMQGLSGLKNLRAPSEIIYSIPKFYDKTMPWVSNPGTAIKTYVRCDVYMGCTFRGRRFMDDGTCRIGNCS
ncbi:putative capsid protein [Trichonephila clavipes]|nr:putative capsid protein [Trichonephila clavipes]